MNKLFKNSLRGLVVVGVSIALCGFFVSGARAGILSDDVSVELKGNTGKTVGGDATDFLTVDNPRVIIAKMIAGLISLVGIGFIIYTVYAGFVYMTAGGDAEKVNKAIGMVRSGIIGVVIIFLSYSITTTVFFILMKRNYSTAQTTGFTGSGLNVAPVVQGVGSGVVGGVQSAGRGIGTALFWWLD